MLILIYFLFFSLFFLFFLRGACGLSWAGECRAGAVGGAPLSGGSTGPGYRGQRPVLGATPRGARGLPCPAAVGHLWGSLPWAVLGCLRGCKGLWGAMVPRLCGTRHSHRRGDSGAVEAPWTETETQSSMGLAGPLAGGSRGAWLPGTLRGF